MTQVISSPSMRRFKTFYKNGSSNDRKKISHYTELCRRSELDDIDQVTSCHISKEKLLKDQDVLVVKKKPSLSSNYQVHIVSEWNTITKSTANTNHLYKNFETTAKNRYSTVHPVEKTRVKLLPRKWCSDYINANYVDGIHRNSEKFYIATQAPTVVVFEDFWRMVFEQNVSVIVMLTKLVEGGNIKADKYWPNEGTVEYCSISVTLDSLEAVKDYEIRNFTITMDGVSKKVTHYYYLGWPDHGVPESASSFLEMLLEIQEVQNKASGPLLLHCSAGIGRTGSFIAIDTVIRRIIEEDLYENDVNMVELIRKIRSFRDGSLTHISQYDFCYNAINEYLTHKNARRN